MIKIGRRNKRKSQQPQLKPDTSPTHHTSTTLPTHYLLLYKNTNHGLSLDSFGGITCHVGSWMDLFHLLFQHWLRTFNCCTGSSHNNNLCRHRHPAGCNIQLYIIYIWHAACRLSVHTREEIAIIQTNPLPTRQ